MNSRKAFSTSSGSKSPTSDTCIRGGFFSHILHELPRQVRPGRHTSCSALEHLKNTNPYIARLLGSIERMIETHVHLPGQSQVSYYTLCQQWPLLSMTLR